MKRENNMNKKLKLLLLFVSNHHVWATTEDLSVLFNSEISHNTYYMQYLGNDNKYHIACPVKEEMVGKTVYAVTHDINENHLFTFTESKTTPGCFNIKPICSNEYLSVAKNNYTLAYLEPTANSDWIVTPQANIVMGPFSSWLVFIQNNNTKNYFTLREDTQKVIFQLSGKEEKVPLSGVWRLQPKYPQKGYSDFNQIIKDYAGAIAYRNGVKQFPTNTLSSSPHDIHGLHFICKGEPTGTNEPSSYTESFRPILKTEEVYHYDSFSEVSYARIIKTEELFSYSIENGLSEIRGEETEKNNRTSETNDERRNTSNNVQKQNIAHNKFQTRLTTIYEKEQTASKSHTETNEDRRNKGTSSSKSEQNNSTHKVHAEASVEGGADIPFLAKGKVKVGGGYSYENSHGKTKTSSAHEDNTNTKAKSDANTNTTGTKNVSSVGKDSEAGTQEMNTNATTAGQEYGKAYTIENSDLNRHVVTHTINLNEVKTYHKKKEEEWRFERRIYQTSRKGFKMTVSENAIETLDVPFSVPINISGYVKFTADKLLTYNNLNYEKDYVFGNDYYICPATIISMLPAPGFVIQSDGSVDYVIRGKMTMKCPIDVKTEIIGDENVSVSAEKIVDSLQSDVD
jgi:hypothetical protein